MCGICGIISRDTLQTKDIEAVKKMNSRMRHRGPDGDGEFLDQQSNQVFLAMRRLSIIDLQGGWQPLHNEDKSLTLVANGEIYNYVELRERLEKAGHHYSTHSDCEAIVHLYEEQGLDCVQSLRGMFGFALWDARQRRLIIGRDRLGEKPIYLYEGDGKLLFASEMKALLASEQVPFDLDPISINQYLHYGWVPEPRTLLKGVRKLAPGHLLIVDVDRWHLQESQYWRFEDAPPVTGNPAGLIRAELEQIAGLIVRSDVPVAVALSGGLDSSLIAALTQKKYPGTMHAFSVGYEGRPRQDERQMAQEFARHLGMPFHEVEISTKEMLDFFPELNYWRDDPIADISGIGYYALNRAARENGFPVLIQGQGGDELFWGYPWTVRAVEESLLKAEGRQRSGLGRFLAHLPKGLSKPQLVQLLYLMGGLLNGWKKLGPDKNTPANQLAFYDLHDSFQIAAYGTHATYHQAFSECLRDSSAAEFFRVPKPWQQVDVLVMRLLFGSYLLQNGMAQGDRLSMASSVELRLPLLDYKLVELVVGLQKNTPSYSLPAKAWLKEAVADLVPEWVINRPKRGFNPPVTPWLNALKLRYGNDLCSGYLVQSSILEAKAARRLIEPQSRFSIWNDLAFKYLILEHWCQAMAGIRKTTVNPA
ncbi:asparagine synthase (glutamine-hydrolysing) [Anaerolineae bacterium]|nr:asparagine synthase (glutamine-hydrolysing) [Anaerolineae bacterium]